MYRQSDPEALPRLPLGGAAVARPTIAHPAVPDPAPAPEPAPRSRARRFASPPSRRAPLWLAALIAGAVVAAFPAWHHGGTTDVAATAADYGLGLGYDVDASGGMDDAGVRQGITEAEAQARLAELAASRAEREPKTVLPTNGVMTTCFCMRWGQFHYGIDLAAPLGTPIYAAVDGVVLRAGPASGFGNAIYIQDADGNVEVYGHMRYYNVKAGDIVHAGEQIAKVGSEGQSTGPHLHFQIDKGSEYGKPINPVPWLQQRGVQVPGA